MSSVLAIIVTYNGHKWIGKCIDSLVQSNVRPDIIVIDNGSYDGTVEYLRTHYQEVIELVLMKENLGFGGANNVGLRRALDKRYDFVYLLNQDAWIEKDTIEKLLDAYDDSYAILSPIQNDADGKLDKQFEKKCGKYLQRFPVFSKNIIDVRFVMAAHWLISLKAIETVGGFSPAFKQYGEDDNWIDRAHYFNLKVGILPSAAAIHDRAGRNPSKESKMQLKCVATIVKLSNPNNCFAFRSVAELVELLFMSVKNLSLTPLEFLPSLIRKNKDLFLLREASKKSGAFL